MEVRGQHHNPATSSPRKYPGTPLNGWLGGPLEAVWAFLVKIKYFACAIIQSPDRPSRNLITVPPRFCAIETTKQQRI
jgi:hypothetical protein